MKNKQSLFDISEDIRALHELLEESGGEVAAEDEAALDDFFAELGAAESEKIDGYCALIAELEAKAEIRSREADRISALAKTDSALASRLKTRLHDYLRFRNEQSFETLRFKIRRQKNGGKRPVILSEYYSQNPVELPEQFRRVEFKPDLERLRENLEGKDTEEAGNYATLGDVGEHLRIK